MKALILAAGQGTRIRSAHGEHPKCLIAFNDSEKTILDQQIHSLFVVGVTEIGIVVGYEKYQIIRHIMRAYRGSLHRFKFIENPRYAQTNNIYSMWLAREWLKGDSFIALNADVAFHSAVLPLAIECEASITMIVDRAWRDETMKVVIKGNRILNMGKHITEEEYSATYIGVTIFRESIADLFFGKIDRLIWDGTQNVFFNAGVQQLIADGVRVGYADVGHLAWAEIDDPADLGFARSHIFPKLAGAEAA
jgi:choline kinase